MDSTLQDAFGSMDQTYIFDPISVFNPDFFIQDDANKVGLTTSTQIFGNIVYSPPSIDHDYASPKHQAAAILDGFDSFDPQPNASVTEYFQNAGSSPSFQSFEEFKVIPPEAPTLNQAEYYNDVQTSINEFIVVDPEPSYEMIPHSELYISSAPAPSGLFVPETFQQEKPKKEFPIVNHAIAKKKPGPAPKQFTKADMIQELSKVSDPEMKRKIKNNFACAMSRQKKCTELEHQEQELRELQEENMKLKERYQFLCNASKLAWEKLDSIRAVCVQK